MSIRFGCLLAVPLALLVGCGKKTLALPADPIERAATCGVVAAATLRTAAGVKGDLSPEDQGRIFHYPLLAASEGGAYDPTKAGAVFKLQPQLADRITKGKWQELQPACAEAYPATVVKQPTLPAGQLDSALQCYMTLDFMRKALADAGASYAEASVKYGAIATHLDPKVSAALKSAGIKGNDAIQVRRKQALADAAKLGPPPAIIAACTEKYGA